MLLSQWLSRFPQSLARPQARRHRRRPQVQVVFRPSDLAKRVDVLEDRTLLATFVVGDGTSLQSALSAANGSPTRDTIILPAGTYSLSGTELQVKQHLNIIGDGADTTIITAGQQSRVLNVFPNV